MVLENHRLISITHDDNVIHYNVTLQGMLTLLVPGLWNDKVVVCSDITVFAGGETIFTEADSVVFLFLVDNRFCVWFDA